MNEIYDRPNKPGIWQNEARVSLYEFLRSGYWRYYVSLTERWGEPNQPLAEGRWRRIVNEYGKQVCDPDSPWPPKVRIEKRRVVEWRHDTDGIMRVCYRRLDEEIRQPNDGVIIRYEIRDCEIGEDDKVIRVIPWKEGE